MSFFGRTKLNGTSMRDDCSRKTPSQYFEEIPANNIPVHPTNWLYKYAELFFVISHQSQPGKAYGKSWVLMS